MTAYTVVDTDRLAFNLFVEFKHFFGTDTHAQAAPLAPFLVDDHLEAFCQKNHLPPKSSTPLVRFRKFYSVANVENISEKFTQIKTKGHEICIIRIFRIIQNFRASFGVTL
jgi:hypothetical protein